MYQIFVQVVGDRIANFPELEQELDAYTGTDPVIIDFNSQGISLKSSGMLRFIGKYRMRHPEVELIVSCPNQCENHLLQKLGVSNCYSFDVPDQILWSINYWSDNPIKKFSYAKRFSHLVGRHTLARCRFSKFINDENLQDSFFLSALKDGGPPTWRDHENPRSWFKDEHDLHDFNEWYDSWHVESADDLSITDQYIPNTKAKKNMIRLSRNWFADVVFESATIGNVFFITEKTVRSLVSEKPFLVYAAVNHLEHMKELGFKTFGELWNENYDRYSEEKRFEALSSVIKNLCAMPNDEFMDIMNKAESITAYNKDNLKNLCIQSYGSFEQWKQKATKSGLG